MWRLESTYTDDLDPSDPCKIVGGDVLKERRVRTVAGAVGPESPTESGEPRGTVAGVVIAGGDNSRAAVPHFQRGGDKRVQKRRGTSRI